LKKIQTKKILLIDNTFDPPHGSPEIRAHLESAAKATGEVEITMVRAPEGAVPADVSSFDGAVLSGSKTRIDEDAPWIQKEMQAIRELHRHKIPTLGICYGEQLIVKTLASAAATGVAPVMEHGWVEIETTGESPVLSGLPKKFHSFEFHKDEVYRDLPARFEVVARSADCAVQAYNLTDAPMWGLQFHPERGLEEGNRGLDRRLAEDANYRAINRNHAEKVFSESVATTIFQNFLKLVKARP
jgi:GMP synthase-like glutamine amidotransferase